ncbi:abc transporter family protein [Stylonychia lemnae]|uniref:Abc transporter family protein n=1 Tax=Stylonychia lemnae TaxID=5949 RepID=A0A078AZT5_STYLE|nr:abc transporter family protein [Stylonychia lemnae]|eukprot:CDW87920.1 abc transporter family protein [Stylonychia lemnae]
MKAKQNKQVKSETPNSFKEDRSSSTKSSEGDQSDLNKSRLNQIKQIKDAEFDKEIQLVWRDLNLYVQPSRGIDSALLGFSETRDENSNKRKQILNSNFGIARSGELTAIIGPSGSGKSSLLSLLSKRYTQYHTQYLIEGSVKLNNVELQHSTFMKYGSFIEQDDVLFESNTPRQTFKYGARFRTSLSDSEIEDRVDIMIHRLGLQECQNQMVGGIFLPKISGGERKRTSIGMELMTNPKILLLDEPTSGLDSENAMRIIKLLKREAKLRGATVICSIHQPSSQLFQLFDRTICLSEGHTIYNGPTNQIPGYFMKNFGLKIKKYTNPADYLIKMAHDPKLISDKLTIDALKIQSERKIRKIVKTTEKQNLPLVSGIEVERASSFYKQCRTLLIRYFEGFLKIPLAIFAIFGISIFMIGLVGSIYFNVGQIDTEKDVYELRKNFQEWLGLSFYLGNDVFAICTMSQVIQIPSRNPLFRKEKLAGFYSTSAFYIITWFASTVFIIFYPLIQSLGIFLCIGTQDQTWENYYNFVKNSMLLGLAGSNFGFMWGTIFDNDNTATTSAMAVVMISSLGAGKFVNLGSKTPIVKLISSLSPIRYAVEGYFRRIVSQQEDYGMFLLNMFGFKLGDQNCQRNILYFAIAFFIIGWVNLKYQARKL